LFGLQIQVVSSQEDLVVLAAHQGLRVGAAAYVPTCI
jgi:hypothetical protein